MPHSTKTGLPPGLLPVPARNAESSSSPSPNNQDKAALDQGSLQRIWDANSVVPRPVQALVHELILGNMMPTDLAVCAHDGSLTYERLDHLSTLLARKLVKLGVCPEKIVPLCFEKSVSMPIAMLGVMKAGGASMALDTTQPETRLKTIVEQVRPEVILCSTTSSQLAHILYPGVTVVPVSESICLDMATETPTQPSRGMQEEVTPSNTLYIVFTSGSTGTPKGVVITHSNFSSALKYQTSELGFHRTTRALDFASYAFDATWYNTLHTLYAGGCLCIPSEDDRKNDLNGSIRMLRPNFANLTPKVAELLDDTSLQQLDTVELAGEAPNAEQVKRMRQKASVRFAYGPAECSVLSTVTDDLAISPMIGYGVGVRTWVVDAEDPRALAPIGSVGELWLEGPLVGKGYYMNAEKTAAAFVQDPVWLTQGAPGRTGRSGRLYRTGDLVRQEGASLVFAGRMDGQVKVRGQRVELGDVEHHVARNLPSSAEAEVVADVLKLDGSADGTLVAFLKAEGNINEAVVGLEALLTELLPTYMIPSIYITLESLGLREIPMTPTGKTDRKCLRELGSALTPGQLAALNLARRAWQAPQTSTEKLLQRLWSEVLNVGCESISANDRFLDLGGDSIKAMRLIPNARKEGIHLTVQDVFKYATLSDLGCHIDMQPCLAHESESNVIEPFSMLRSSPAAGRQAAAEACRVSVDDIEDMFPCTPLQTGLMALSIRGVASYVIRQTFDLRPDVHLDNFKAAWETVAIVEPILRTRIVDLGSDGFVQVIVKSPLQWLYEEPESNADLEMSMGLPLCRFGLFEDRVNDRVRFSWTMHHAICDGWSTPLLLDQLEAAYSRQELRPSRPFQQFVKYIDGVAEADAGKYWQSVFHGTEAEPFPRLPAPDYQPKAQAEVRHEIRNISWSRRNATPSTLIRAAWSLLTAQYTATNDVSFGTTVSGRHAPVNGVEMMTGPTIATIPFRTLIDPQESVAKFLERIQRQSIEAIEYEQFGLQNIRRISEDTERACAFQTLLLVQPPDQVSTTAGSLFITGRGRPKYGLNDFNTYALMLECELEDDALRVRINFDSEITETEQASQMLYQLEGILRQLCSTSSYSMKLADVELASDSDVERILGWNAKIIDAVDAGVHDLVAERAREHPAALAVCGWDGSLTYGELDELSSLLAFHLAALDVGPEAIVPLSFEKSMWVPVAMLAVLKAGGTFTMLPPSLPRARLDAMLQTVTPKVVLAFDENAHLFPQQFVICPKTATSGGRQSKEQRIHRRVAPSSTAAVLFTSGSTGVPKAILLDHCSISTAATYLGRDCGAGRSTRVFQFASYLFDVSIHETFMALLYGSCICIPSELSRENNLGGAMTDLQANWACLAPSVADLLSPEDTPTLRTLVFAGEKLAKRHIAKWVNRVAISNWYGPAEASVCSTTPVQFPRWKDGVLGSGSAARCWIVSRENPNILTPVGAIGELVAEGPIVMKGYLNDAEKSASVLVQNPTWLRLTAAGVKQLRFGRIYKTGDLVRYDTDGSIVYVGRKDAQVKLRGQRVELGDVEQNVLEKIGSLGHTFYQVVAEVVKPSSSSSPMLVVYLRADGEAKEPTDGLQPIMLAGLKDKLAECLPSHMIPSAYLVIDEIPMTPSGKIDRRRLRSIGGDLTVEQLRAVDVPNQAVGMKQPETMAEKQMLGLWASVLGKEISTIDTTDSFFDLGGESIAAMRLVNAARKDNLSITVADVFKKPHLNELASLVRPVEQVVHDSVKPFSLLTPGVAREITSAPGTSDKPISDAFPVTHFQASCIDDALQTPPKRWSYFHIDLPNESTIQEATEICERLWDHVQILRTVFVQYQGKYLQVLPSDIRPKIIRYHSSEETTIELSQRVFQQDSRAPGILGTPFCAFFVLESAATLRLGIRLSHAQYDGTSLLWIMKSIKAIYEKQKVPSTPQFSSFIRHTLENTKPAKMYWKKLLYGSDLTRMKKAQNHRAESGLVAVRKTASISSSISGFTAATVFTSACAQVVAHGSNTTDVTFGRVVSGRAMLPVHLRDTVGPCLNTVPVRVHAGQRHNMLQSVHDQHIEGMHFETLGFGEIVESCTDWPRNARAFGCVTHYQDLGDAQEEFGGVGRTLKCHQRDMNDAPEDDILRITATPAGDGSLHLELTASSRFYSTRLLEQWANKLVAILCNM